MIRIAVACFTTHSDGSYHSITAKHVDNENIKKHYVIVPDVENKLPGRGTYILPCRLVLKAALKSK